MAAGARRWATRHSGFCRVLAMVAKVGRIAAKVRMGSGVFASFLPGLALRVSRLTLTVAHCLLQVPGLSHYRKLALPGLHLDGNRVTRAIPSPPVQTL
jgi:hypothetical protein